MVQEIQILESGTLWSRTIDQTKQALECGALQPIPTQYEFVEQNGIRFLVRIVSNLVRKDEAKQKQGRQAASGKEFNPFLPYDPDLFVADLSATHLCLLNKFNIVDYHLLIVTRSFEEQETWLTESDFEAALICLAEIDGLVFYNSGQAAGASQRHKHLQLMPLPMTPEGPKLPIEPALASARFEDAIGRVADFPFQHACIRLSLDLSSEPKELAAGMLQYYHTLLEAVNLQTSSEDKPSGAYNLLITREWMLLVPRQQERFASISINSVGFAGGLLVRHEEQLQLLKEKGPLAILKGVAVPL